MNLALRAAVNFNLPGWLQTPTWYRPLTRNIAYFVHDHQALGLFVVILAEEVGIPLPAPGDVAIATGGYLTTTGDMTFPAAFIAVVLGATLGSLVLFSISRRYGHPFVLRFGGYVGLNPDRLGRAERAFRRWGPWAIIIGRHIPGMRIVLSAFAGIFDVPLRVFVPCVVVSSSAWALIFLLLGRALGRRSLLLFRLIPAHLLPWAITALFFAVATWIAFEHGWRPMRERRRRRAPIVETSGG